MEKTTEALVNKRNLRDLSRLHNAWDIFTLWFKQIGKHENLTYLNTD